MTLCKRIVRLSALINLAHLGKKERGYRQERNAGWRDRETTIRVAPGEFRARPLPAASQKLDFERIKGEDGSRY
jgi:hypothetical protein